MSSVCITLFDQSLSRCSAVLQLASSTHRLHRRKLQIKYMLSNKQAGSILNHCTTSLIISDPHMLIHTFMHTSDAHTCTCHKSCWSHDFTSLWTCGSCLAATLFPFSAAVIFRLLLTFFNQSGTSASAGPSAAGLLALAPCSSRSRLGWCWYMRFRACVSLCIVSYQPASSASAAARSSCITLSTHWRFQPY